MSALNELSELLEECPDPVMHMGGWVPLDLLLRVVREAAEIRAAALWEAADVVVAEAWPHERDERENELLYELSDKLLRMAGGKP